MLATLDVLLLIVSSPLPPAPPHPPGKDHSDPGNSSRCFRLEAQARARRACPEHGSAAPRRLGGERGCKLLLVCLLPSAPCGARGKQQDSAGHCCGPLLGRVPAACLCSSTVQGPGDSSGRDKCLLLCPAENMGRITCVLAVARDVVKA